MIEQTTQRNNSRSSITLNSGEIRANVNDDSDINDDNDDNDDDDDDDDDDGSLDDSSRSITPESTEHRKYLGSIEKIPSVITAHDTDPDIDPINNLNRLYESLNKRSYIFDYCVKSGSNKHFKVRTDVSGEQIRFDFLEKTSRLASQTILLPTQRLAACCLLEKDKNKRRGKYISLFVFSVGMKICQRRERQFFLLKC